VFYPLAYSNDKVLDGSNDFKVYKTERPYVFVLFVAYSRRASVNYFNLHNW
jgi:hypothetical protein